MKKMIIIDDRPNRQKSILRDQYNQLNTFSNLKIEKSIPKDYAILNDYSVVAVHHSLLKEKNIESDIIKFCSDNNKSLILFSGGTSALSQMSVTIIEISAVQLYNAENLTPFIKSLEEDIMPELLQIVYGSKWSIVDLLKYQYIYWRYKDNMPDNIDEEFNDLSERICATYMVQKVDINFVKTKISSLLKQF